jgi:hypothetical protein
VVFTNLLAINGRRLRRIPRRGRDARWASATGRPTRAPAGPPTGARAGPRTRASAWPRARAPAGPRARARNRGEGRVQRGPSRRRGAGRVRRRWRLVDVELLPVPLITRRKKMFSFYIFLLCNCCFFKIERLQLLKWSFPEHLWAAWQTQNPKSIFQHHKHWINSWRCEELRLYNPVLECDNF